MPSVSVIIPTWNRGHTIRKAIESALSQVSPVAEVLVCDDGSTDNTAEVVTAIARHDSRLRWLPGERAGLPAIPRNRGIKESRGEWLAFLDSDDTWEPNKIREQLEAAQRLGCLAACSNALRLLPDGREAGLLLDWHRLILTLSDLLSVNRVVCSSCIVHRSVLDRTGGFPITNSFKAGEDYALWLRVAATTKFAYCPLPLVRYMDDPGESIRANQPLTPVQLEKLILSDLQQWLRALPEKFPGHRRVLIQTWIARRRHARKHKYRA